MEEDFRLIVEINREIEEIEDIYLQIPRRYVRDVQNPVEFYNDIQFKYRYRFSKETVLNILLPILEPLQKVTNRGLPVPPIISLLLTLRFYATGSFQMVCGDLRGLHQTTVSRMIKKVSRLIAAQTRHYIKFPNNQQELRKCHTLFYRVAQFPSVTGCIDCTHVPIKSPGGDMAEVFRNRKRTFSINVQIVAGPNMEIFDVVARWPGREHDSTIFNNSSVKARFERGILQGYLLGDSAYACTSYMMTPLLNPTSDAEHRYNRSQIRTRNIVERTFGLLKRRFPCLSRGLGNKTETICLIIVVCCILHNISIKTKDEFLDIDNVRNDELLNNYDMQDNQNQPQLNGMGHAVRRALIQRYFQN